MDLAGALGAISLFEQLLPVEGEYEFHADLSELRKYDADAREAWTKVLRRQHDRCTKIVIYGARPLVRMAAATVAMLARLPIELKDKPPT